MQVAFPGGGGGGAIRFLVRVITAIVSLINYVPDDSKGEINVINVGPTWELLENSPDIDAAALVCRVGVLVLVIAARDITRDLGVVDEAAARELVEVGSFIAIVWVEA